MRGSIMWIACGFVALAVITGCTCGNQHVVVAAAGPGESFRDWRVGDTASVWAVVGSEPRSPDVVCDRYASRAAPNYHDRVEPDNFTFQSSRPDVATVTNHGLVTALQVGQTDITATSLGTVSPALIITVQAAPLVHHGAPPNKRLKLAAPVLKRSGGRREMRYGRIAFVNIPAERRSLSAIR